MGSVQPAYAESFGAASAHLSRRSAAKAEHPTPKLNSEESCSLLLKVALVNLIHNVLCENRSGPAPGAQAFLDQGPIAVESGFLFDQSAHFRSATAHRLRKRAVPEPLGMLEPGDSDVHDRGGPLHTRVRVLRGDNGETVCLGGRRAATRGRSGHANEIETCRDHGRRSRRFE